MVAQSLPLLSTYSATGKLSPTFTGLVCSRKGRNRSFSSPQERKAPTFPVCATVSTATSPTLSAGCAVVEISLSFESLVNEHLQFVSRRTARRNLLCGKQHPFFRISLRRQVHAELDPLHNLKLLFFPNLYPHAQPLAFLLNSTIA